MFIQVMQGRATNPDGIHAELDRWKAELQPGADGWLGSTSGVTDDGQFIAVVRFASEELARRNSDRPEQDAWWTQASAEHADRPGDFTQTVYFTFEEHARRFEREQPVEFDPSFAEFSSLMTDVRYFDLRNPRLDSPG